MRVWEPMTEAIHKRKRLWQRLLVRETCNLLKIHTKRLLQRKRLMACSSEREFSRLNDN